MRGRWNRWDHWNRWNRWNRIGWRGALETAGIVALFVGFGLAWAGLLEWASPAPPAYPRPVVEEPGDEPSIWLLDGFNVLHAGPLGGRDRTRWWTEPRRRELLDLVRGFDDPNAEVWVVFDGPEPVPEDSGEGRGAAGPPRCVFAPSADTWLLARVREAECPSRIAVVTADRKVAERARHRGARVYTPREFLARCARPSGVC